jgi:hypothetical protein
MLAANLFGLLVSLTSFTGPVSSLPINEAIGALGKDGPFEERAIVTGCKSALVS